MIDLSLAEERERLCTTAIAINILSSHFPTNSATGVYNLYPYRLLHTTDHGKVFVFDIVLTASETLDHPHWHNYFTMRGPFLCHNL